jgi:hypothetical protein
MAVAAPEAEGIIAILDWIKTNNAARTIEITKEMYRWCRNIDVLHSLNEYHIMSDSDAMENMWGWQSDIENHVCEFMGVEPRTKHSYKDRVDDLSDYMHEYFSEDDFRRFKHYIDRCGDDLLEMYNTKLSADGSLDMFDKIMWNFISDWILDKGQLNLQDRGLLVADHPDRVGEVEYIANHR